MTWLYFVLLVLAAACFLLSSVGQAVTRSGKPINLVALGLLFWSLVLVIQTGKSLF